jgi:type IV secretion system protein VirB3
MTAPMEESDPRDPLFKGCTRPAMVFGVPLAPLAVVTGTVVLLAIWTTLFIGLLLIPIVLVMRIITKSDDQQFRLLGLKIMFRGVNLPLLNRLFSCNRNDKFWKASTYSPIPFTKRK